RLHANFEEQKFEEQLAERSPPRANGNGAYRPHVRHSSIDHGSALDHESLGQQVLAEVRRIAQPLAGRTSLDSTLADAGLDSLGRMELLAALECRLGVRLSESFGPELRTVGDVSAAVYQQMEHGIRGVPREVTSL